MATTARARWLKEAAAAGNAFHYRTRKALPHNLLNITGLLAIVAAYAGIGALARVVPWYLYLPLATVLLGTLLFALFILVIHECSHNMFLVGGDPDRTRRLNHGIGDVVAALVFTNYRQHWEKGHTAHHLHPMEVDLDPQVPDPLDGPRLGRKLLFLALIPGYAFIANPSDKYGFQPLRVGVAVSFWAVVTLTLGWTCGWPAGVAAFLAWNVVAALNLLKIVQEHGSELREEPDPWLRSRTYFYPLWPLFSPFCMNYHFEHHINFAVPWYLLPAYHRVCLKLMPEELRPYLLTYGAREYLTQAAGTRPRIPEALRGLVEAPRAESA